MSARVTSDPAEFQATTFAFLERDPVLNTVIMTNVAERAAGRRLPENGTAYYVSVHDDSGEVVGATMRTPGRPIHLGSLREDLAPEVADTYAELLPDAPGVAGDRAVATVFANRWSELHGVTWTETRCGVRLHKLVELNHLEAEGKPRRMTEPDIQRAADWNTDGFVTDSPTVDLAWARGQLEQGTMWFWQVGGVLVSMASYHLPLFGVCRVGPVYTPVADVIDLTFSS